MYKARTRPIGQPCNPSSDMFDAPFCRRAKVLPTVGILAAAFAFAFASPALAQTHKWRHSVLEPKSDAGIILMAARRGFFKKLGLDVEIVEIKNEMLGQRAAVAGELDSFDGSPPFAAVASGANLKVIGCHWTVLPYHIFARENVKTIADMRGKTIATSASGSAPDMVARAVLDFHKVPVDSVRFANVGSDADRYRAVIQGVVDATVVSGEYTPNLTRDKLHSIATAKEALPGYDRLCMTASNNSLTKKRADAVRFLAGMMNGLAYAMTHRAETIALTREITSQKADDLRPEWIYDNAIEEKAVDATIPLSIQRLEGMKALLQKAGALTKNVDVATMVDLKLREEALAIAGK